MFGGFKNLRPNHFTRIDFRLYSFTITRNSLLDHHIANEIYTAIMQGNDPASN